jgi:DNA-binding GntR family transcriptional regulator
VAAPTLKKKIADEVRSAILRGDLPPGTRIVESKLAKQMQVAQTTVREGLQELENQGLVVKRVNHETLVRKLRIGEIEKLLDLRMDLEGLAAELASRNANEATLAPLQEIVDRMRWAAQQKKWEEFYRFDFEFHNGLYRLADNEFLEAVLARLSVGVVAFVLAGLRIPLRINYVQVANDHAEVLDALREGTARAARKLMEAKLRHWHNEQVRSFNAPHRE